MLNKLTLTNFMRHRALTMTFSEGLNALRGSNEMGKSSSLKAVAYALFGVKALGATLAEAVTWGEPEASLKVELEFTTDNVAYSIKRGKSGAECTYAGGIVTGQTEVTNFVSRLMKVDAAAASRLMLAGQNEIRGALESGPKATTELIERLSEFDQIDNLIELMQVKLSLGSPAMAEAALARAQATVESAKEAAVAPDYVGMEKAIGEARLAHQASAASLVVARKWEVEAQEAHAQAREKAVARNELQRRLTRNQESERRLAEVARNLEVIHAPPNAEARIAKLRVDERDAGEQKALRALYLQAVPFFAERSSGGVAGTLEQMEAELVDGVEELNGFKLKSSSLAGEIRLLSQQLTHGSCSFCGKDFSGVPEVEAKNAEIQGRLRAAEAALASSKSNEGFKSEFLDGVRVVISASRPALKFLSVNADKVEQADGLLPPVLRWLGTPPTATDVDVSIIRSEIAELTALQKAYDNAQARLEALRPQLEAAKAEGQSLLVQVESIPLVVLPQGLLDASRESVKQAIRQENEALGTHADLVRALKDAKDSHTRALKSLDDALEAVSTRSAEIGALEFNNALLKKVKQARPAIANNLWAVVLKAVSGYFSEIRGEKSRVTKDVDGFKVDGHPVSTLSGSTLDALGLSIRVALVRTFLPTAPFLILDEPGSGMDVERTGSMLGFLSRVGFSQVILCSHDSLSESVADHVIGLE